MASHTAKIRTKFLTFLGLSRFQQAVWSLAEPAFVVLVALKALPDPNRMTLIIAVTLAGYLAANAANDLLDIDIDRPRFSRLRRLNEFDIDWAAVKHPLAQGYLSFAHSAIWMISLALFAIVGAYLLNPISAVLFAVAGLLEVTYCKLAKVTAFKFLPAGVMVAAGGLAAWFAVAPTVDVLLLATLFLWLYGWEVGGRNMIKDWSDLDEDIKAGIKTVPVVYGRRAALWVIVFHVVLSALAGIFVGYAAHLNPLYFVLAFVAGNYLMAGPGVWLLYQPKPETALFLLNRASLYPPLMLLALVASIFLPF